MKQSYRPRPRSMLLTIAAGLVPSLALAAPATPADTIYTGGPIVTVNELQPQVRPLPSAADASSPPGIATR